MIKQGIKMARIEQCRLDRPVVIYPYFNKGGFMEQVDGAKPLTLAAPKAEMFIKELRCNENLDLIEESLQSMAQREDGTLLLSSFTSVSEFIKKTNGFFEMSLINSWIDKGCNQIHIDFEEGLNKPSL
jgi:hypothetical protein